MYVMVETSSRVPSRPPALSWHTHGESANQTLALDIPECQRGYGGAIRLVKVATNQSVANRWGSTRSQVRSNATRRHSQSDPLDNRGDDSAWRRGDHEGRAIGPGQPQPPT
jgi:hypothetical protein